MILTKTEFRAMFGYTHASQVSRLIANGSIVITDNKRIDLDDPVNKKWAKTRKNELKEARITPNEAPVQQKSEDQLSLEIEVLNQKVKTQKQQSTLLDLKIAKEKREVIETEVLNKVLITVFNALFQNLAELPSIYVDDLIAIIKTNNSPKEQFVKFLTDKILSQIQSSLDVAENAAQKHYE